MYKTEILNNNFLLWSLPASAPLMLPNSESKGRDWENAHLIPLKRRLGSRPAKEPECAQDPPFPGVLAFCPYLPRYPCTIGVRLCRWKQTITKMMIHLAWHVTEVKSLYSLHQNCFHKENVWVRLLSEGNRKCNISDMGK